MKKLFCIALLLMSYITAAANSPTDSLLQELDRELAVMEVYVAHKLERISSLKGKLQSAEISLTDRYNLNYRIFSEYQSFNFDSAFTYANKLQKVARELKDTDKITAARMQFGFIFLSSGMYKEAIDTLGTIHTPTLPHTTKPEYFSLMARVYYGIADFNSDSYYTRVYNTMGNQFIDSVLLFSAPQSFEYLYFRGLRNARMLNINEGLSDLEQLNTRSDLTYHQAAVVASTLSDIYLRLGNTDKAIGLLAKAAIFDIKASIKETAAILIIADILRQQGQIRKAYEYTRHALNDANFYNARHRKIRVGTILPIIEEEKSIIVEGQKQRIITYAVVVTVLILCVFLFILIILKQLKKLKLADKEILKSNSSLQHTNHKLLEANKIKEEYIGYYFNINSEYLDKIEKFKESVDHNLTTKRFDHLRYVVKNIDLKKEREELYKSFDKVFLKLFPDFISSYNTLFKEEDQVCLGDMQLLNTDLRIFALIRMGISDNDKIAKILGYSVNTIYAYKTRIKNKAIVPNEEFEKRIMEIETV
ncbi:hypothetical protein D770_00990 [Flammeovirgaceae bacterium 311]|nr:hypothetical protein D770_00990 [Flammeovirgaceae bacterium 311]